MQKAFILTFGDEGFLTTTSSHLQDKGNWNNLARTELKSQYTGFSDRNQFLTLCWISPDGFHLSDIARRFICTYWRVSAGPHLKLLRNSPEASQMRLSGSRNQCLDLMKGALPIKCSVRLLLMMTHQWGQYERSVCCGTIDSLNQDLYRTTMQDVVAWWYEESSPCVSALERWEWVKLSSLFQMKGLDSDETNKLHYYSYMINLVLLYYILQQETRSKTIKENVAFEDFINRFFLSKKVRSI